MKKIQVSVSTIFLLIFSGLFCYAQSEGTPWIASDDLGRVTANPADVPEIRDNRTVGIFYFIWMLPMSNIPADPNGQGEPYDINKILAKDPDAFRNEDNTKLGKNGEMHFWGEPLYGYYDSRDPWVIRRHLQLLSDAGVDVLMFDATNAQTYPEVWRAILLTMKDMRAHGEATPQITFVLHTEAGKMVDFLWDNLYNTGEYDEFLYQWEGKPLLVCDINKVREDLRNKFTFRRTRWQYEGMANMQNAWTWIATYPQPYGWAEDESIPEQINVSVAQNLNRFGDNIELRKKTFREATGWDCPEWVYSKNEAVPGAGLDSWMCDNTARGRSYWKNEYFPENAVNEGRNFSEQWSRAYELDPLFVMITGWNEWIAGRWLIADHYIFIDQYNQEYSRDAEPMKGGHFDNYYLQMVDGIRRYKGMRRYPVAAMDRKIDLNDFSTWNTVTPDFSDHQGETIPRDFDGVGKTHYTNDSGRNDLELMKVARNPENVWFYLKATRKIIPKQPNGLCLLLDTDDNLNTGWIGGDYLIGRQYGQETVSLEKFSGNQTNEWNWTTVENSNIRWNRNDDELVVEVPRSLFSDTDLTGIRFKWMDNVPNKMTTEDLYMTGDVAPESRFFYQIDFSR